MLHNIILELIKWLRTILISTVLRNYEKIVKNRGWAEWLMLVAISATW
jgi:hypothetical protein